MASHLMSHKRLSNKCRWCGKSEAECEADQFCDVTTEMRDALSFFAAVNGHRWKSKLRDAWMNGGYDSERGEYIVAELQQFRNQFGPSGLDRVTGEMLAAKG